MHLPPNLCLTPFIFATIDPAGNQSPCPTLGGNLWNFNNIPLAERWQTSELHFFRKKMLDNGKFRRVCQRCWDEEDAGGYSLRKEVWDHTIDPTGTTTKLLGTNITPQAALTPEFYSKGPMQLVLKVSNVCNLRCRSCNSVDSYLYKIEGNRYHQLYGVQEPFYTQGPDKVEWSDEQLEEIFKFTENLTRLELYGGEPLLDKQTPKLLKKLVDSGRSKRIDLNISTNATIVPNTEWIDIVSKFKSFNLNLSIDGLGEHFEYLRHPGRWSNVVKNIDWFAKDLKSILGEKQHFTVLPTVTVSILNVYYLPELFNWFKENYNLDCHLNIATNPHWYNIINLPPGVKRAVVEKYKEFNIEKLNPVLKFMALKKNDENRWREFVFWTRAKDEYRGENFKNTFPEFVQVIERVQGPTFNGVRSVSG